MGKTLSNKYGQKLLDSAKKSTTHAIKTASKRAIQKIAEAAGDLIGNKIADKITSVSKKSTKELQNNGTEEDVEKATPKKRYTSLEERQQIIDEMRLVPKKDTYFQKLLTNLMLTLERYVSPEERQQIIDELRLV